MEVVMLILTFLVVVYLGTISYELKRIGGLLEQMQRVVAPTRLQEQKEWHSYLLKKGRQTKT